MGKTDVNERLARANYSSKLKFAIQALDLYVYHAKSPAVVAGQRVRSRRTVIDVSESLMKGSSR